MCGILGSITKNEIDIKSMSKIIAHRGPDDEGFYSKKFDDYIIHLAHRRLSIIDLSPAGHQPMSNEDGTIWITYNGEIYNYQELMSELKQKDHIFKSKSDTETIIHAYEEWGIACLNKFNGIFAFAIWDEKKKQLFIARDRFGVKPLYYAHINNNFVFASEFKAVLKSGLIKKELNFEAINSYFVFGSVLPPETMVNDIFCLLPASYIIYKNNNLEIKEYYNILESRIKNKKLKEENIIQKTKNLLEKSIKRQLVADVPVGVFLSGGIDSSSIVAVASKFASKLKTISIGFSEKGFDETNYAETVAKIFETNHQKLVISGKDVLNEMPKIIQSMDQPTIDGINTYFVSKAAHQFGLKVALSGLGGDEVFCGYSHFRKLPKIYKLTKILFLLDPNLRKRIISPIIKNDFNKIKEYLSSDGDYLDLYLLSRSLFPKSFIKNIINKGFENNKYLRSLESKVKNLDIVNIISYLELKLYMHHTLLRDTDFMSMTHSLEVRVPLLDEDLVEWVFNLPGKFKIRKLNKRLLLKASGLYDKAPQYLYKRHKVGFSFPLEKWAKTEFKDMVSVAIEDIKRRFWINRKEIDNLWQMYLNNIVSWSRIWALVILELWLKEHFDY